MFVLPVLTYTRRRRGGRRAALAAHDPAAGAGARRARSASRAPRSRGGRSRGQECSGYWPAGTAAFHINADIADAARRYVAATGDEEFEREVGLELLVETARLWRSLGHHDSPGSFHIDGVTGPDEYSAIADNNVYTNLMAQRNLRVAADAAAQAPAGRARARASTPRRWRAGATRPRP